MTLGIPNRRSAPTLATHWKTLEGRGWLAARSPLLLKKLRAIARVRSFVRKEPIYLAGDPPNGLFGIACGSVHLTLPCEDGVDFTSCRLGVGAWLGAHTCLGTRAQCDSVWAAEDCATICLPGPELRRIVSETPALQAEFSDLAYESFGFALRLLANFSGTDVNSRVAGRLLIELDGRGDAAGWIALSQPEFAEMLAVSLPTLQRCLRRLTAIGCIRIGYSRIQVLDRGALEAFRARSAMEEVRAAKPRCPSPAASSVRARPEVRPAECQRDERRA